MDSLDEIIKEKSQFIEWKFENETLDNIPEGEIKHSRVGNNMATLDTWEHI